MAGKPFFTGKTEYTFTQIISSIAVFTLICHVFFYFTGNSSIYIRYSDNDFRIGNTILNVTEYLYSLDVHDIPVIQEEKSVSEVFPSLRISDTENIYLKSEKIRTGLIKVYLRYKEVEEYVLISDGEI